MHVFQRFQSMQVGDNMNTCSPLPHSLCYSSNEVLDVTCFARDSVNANTTGAVALNCDSSLLRIKQPYF
jgi:hypothetical protein